jgi:mitogen-activated protein kinase kinase
VDVAAWVKGALERRERGLQGHLEKPALHTVALDAVVGSPILEDPLAISEV